MEELHIGINAPHTGPVYPVRGLSFSVSSGEIVALVGESGCGKSVTALGIMRLLKPGLFSLAGGKILFRGRDIATMSDKDMRKLRGREMAMIFQEPMTALNPVFTIEDQISEAVTAHMKPDRTELRKRVRDLLAMVGMPDVEQVAASWPHQLSGGLRQRAMIAMAMACDPDLIIADEPTTALDVSIQAQILDLLREMQEKRGLGMLLITHNLGVVARTADRVLVMYAGRIVEEAPVKELFANPMHPYTRGLMNAVPHGAKKERKRLKAIPGTVPPLSAIPEGCAFRNRCGLAEEKCGLEIPEPVSIGVNRRVACVKAPQGQGGGDRFFTLPC